MLEHKDLGEGQDGREKQWVMETEHKGKCMGRLKRVWGVWASVG